MSKPSHPKGAFAFDLAALGILLVMWVLVDSFDISRELAFWALEGLFAFYVCVRLRLLSKRHEGGMLTPIGIFFFFQFLVQVVIGNFSLPFYASHFNAGWGYLFKSMVIMALAAIALMIASSFRGCRGLGERLGAATIRKISLGRFNAAVSVTMLLLSTLVYLYSMSIGVIGYSDTSTVGAYVDTSSFAQYLIYIADIGFVVLIVSYYVKLTDPFNIAARNVFLAAAAIRVCLALLNGMRSELFFIVICLAIMHYIVKRKLPKWIVLAPVVVLLSYGVYDSYRSMLRADGGSRSELLLAAASSSDFDLGGTLITLMARLNLTESLSAIVKYGDATPLTSNDPAFLLDLILLPITTFVPRALFPWKSMTTYGLWVTHQVHGAAPTVMSSSYVTVEGFYYLAGGMLCVFVGFLTLGLFLEFVGGFLKDIKTNPIAATVFLMLCYKVLFEASTPIDIVTPCIRGIIIFSLVSYLLVGWRRRREGRESGSKASLSPQGGDGK